MASFTQANYNFGYPVNGMAENCRQAAVQHSSAQGPWTLPNGMMVQQPPSWVHHEQNGQYFTIDSQRPTPFTNGRKRSRENIECEAMKKAKTEMESQLFQQSIMQQNQQGLFNNQGFIQQQQQAMQLQQQGFNSCFPSSLMDHQLLMRAERQYDGSLLATLVAEAHGC